MIPVTEIEPHPDGGHGYRIDGRLRGPMSYQAADRDLSRYRSDPQYVVLRSDGTPSTIYQRQQAGLEELPIAHYIERYYQRQIDRMELSNFGYIPVHDLTAPHAIVIRGGWYG